MADPRICSIPGCDKTVFQRGWCNSHYKRWRRHGDPLAGKTAWGEPSAWLTNVALRHEGDDCLQYPYYRNQNGYGWMRHRGTNRGAHVVVCEAVHGPAPSPKHEACHTCGNGAEGCVNPKHLYWGTRADNVADAIKHGTAYRFPVVFGEKSSAARYSAEVVAQVREMLASGHSQSATARAFGMSQGHVWHIKNGLVRPKG
jgi:hypothetical protein